MKEELTQIILDEHQLIRNSTSSKETVTRLNNIIQIKVNFDFGIDSSIYVELKSIAGAYLHSLEEEKFNYDVVNFTFITAVLHHLTTDEKIAFLNYFLQLLKKNDLKSEVKHFEKIYAIERVKKYSAKWWELKNLSKLVHIFINYNIFTLLVSLLSIIGLLTCLFLPAPDWSFVLFQLNYPQITSSPFLNEFYNVILWLAGLNDGFSVLPVNFVGLLVLLFFKLLLLGLIFDVGFEQIKQKLGL